MKLYFDTQSAAQSKADEIHEWLIANDPAYAQSVDADQTLRWDAPKQDRDAAGKVIPTSKWGVIIKPRCMGALTQTEKANLK